MPLDRPQVNQGCMFLPQRLRAALSEIPAARADELTSELGIDVFTDANNPDRFACATAGDECFGNLFPGATEIFFKYVHALFKILTDIAKRNLQS